MAQKTEKEETEFKVVRETIAPCVNNCGVSGNPATGNLCQKCFDAVSTSVSASSVTIPHKFSDKSPRSTVQRSSPETTRPGVKKQEDLRLTGGDDSSPAPPRREVSRCSGCRRKVGLTGFRCRCGELFCGEHRYSDRHDCSYDYKAAGREAIARENPVVKAAKIIKL
ncbi:zinc finger A20 and AN1 domain-containing stress-associated protein 5-like [Ipomoea triloba]|uniref:zinc finger A20 and AN1 domain-containing stress-associated protein 5-like n=1 Tax=Ipomoea triloba TaxID=35885 RepID=UPI00125CE36B|nr:zinc finger A20 and AN1 domain-containing stress-associated protein 5-like [Ipomoea triloba]